MIYTFQVLLRLLFLPFMLAPLAVYHFLEVLFNGPNSVGYWTKVVWYIQGKM